MIWPKHFFTFDADDGGAGSGGNETPPAAPETPAPAAPAVLQSPVVETPAVETPVETPAVIKMTPAQLDERLKRAKGGERESLAKSLGFDGVEALQAAVEAGKNARDKRTNKPFKGGEAVTSEEMLWCGQCRPCADGQPNHCEQLDEVGFNVNGAYTKYIKLPARTLWSLEPLRKNYSEQNLFVAGSLVEPTCVAYNAVIERGGGIKPGDRVVILGAGPVGIAACAILKRAGASQVIISETQPERAAMALKLGADYHVNPAKEDFADRVLEITDGMGADMFMEATGLPTVVYPGIERVIWEGRTLLSTVVVTARAEAKMPVTGEVLQVRKARIVGAQGHSGHGTFPRVIDCMATGMDMTAMSTKKVSLEELPENIIKLQTDRSECKVTYVAK